MSVRRVLVIYKVSLLRRLDRKAARRAPGRVRAGWIRSDVENRAALLAVVRALARTGWEVDLLPRGERFREASYDLIVVVGGDGTLFDVARHVLRAPILAVNSDPPHSLALFSSGDYRSFPDRIADLQSGRLAAVRLNRMRVRVGSRALPPVFNDVLFAHRDPAAMSRYEITVGGRWERQRSSGVWICTAAGSTAAMLAAGGRMMPIRSTALQWRVREPYVNDTRRYQLTHGVTTRALRLVPNDEGMMLWMDGIRHRHALEPEEPVWLETPGPPLRILGYDEARRQQVFGARALR